MANPSGAGALATLKIKMQNLRDELDKSRDEFEIKCQELEKEKAQKTQIETELSSVSRKLRLVEDDFEQAQTRLQTANEKLAELSKVVDENDRSRRVLENRQNIDDDRIENLEHELKLAKAAATDAEKKHEEVVRKLQMSDAELERAEERADTAEKKLKHLDSELLIAANALKSLEHSESKATLREDTYEETIRDLSARLKDAENRASDSERSVVKFQKEVERLEDEMEQTRTQNKALKDELEAAFQEIANI